MLLHWPCDCESTPETRCYLYLVFSLTNEPSPWQLQIPLWKTIWLMAYFHETVYRALWWAFRHDYCLSFILTALCMIIRISAVMYHVYMLINENLLLFQTENPSQNHFAWMLWFWWAQIWGSPGVLVSKPHTVIMSPCYFRSTHILHLDSYRPEICGNNPWHLSRESCGKQKKKIQSVNMVKLHDIGQRRCVQASKKVLTAAQCDISDCTTF